MKVDLATLSPALQRLNPALFPASPKTSATGESCPESEIQDDIESWLKSLGRKCYYVRSRMDRPTTCAVGTPDFVGWYRGQPFALEVKRPGRKPTPAQTGALLWAECAGAKSAVVHSVAEANKALNCSI